ncbi:MAG: trypsin-like peptidase domain-containing protein [Oscillospiraceae bacterium]|nr:trypsin-like peptidase domain-containing protein [Oscillospiraceae bacterium]
MSESNNKDEFLGGTNMPQEPSVESDNQPQQENQVDSVGAGEPVDASVQPQPENPNDQQRSEYTPGTQYPPFNNGYYAGQPQNQYDQNYSANQFPNNQQTVQFSPISTVKPEKTPNVGLRVFVCLLAAVIVITGCLTGGYLAGRSVNNSSNNLNSISLAPKPSGAESNSNEQIYNDLKASVVGILVYNADGSSESSASGVIYTADGYIITNDHIYENIESPQFLINTYDGKEYKATYVAGDARSDLAVLKIDGVSDLTPAVFGNSSELVVGESVIAIGYPAGFNESPIMTSGMISSVGRRATTTSSYSTKFIQTDSAINPGSSGGALINSYSQVVGITSAKLVGNEYDSIGFAIPSVQVKKVVDSLIEYSYVKNRAKLGINYTMVDSVTASLNNVPTGLYVASISADSGMYNIGVNVGDIITHISDATIKTSSIALDIIEASSVGDVLVMTVYNSQTKQSANYNVTMIEDKGSSSYTTNIVDDSKDSKSGSSSNGNSSTFDFPFGE